MECEGANREQERKAAPGRDFLDLVTLLSSCMPQKEAEACARALLSRFSGAAGVFECDVQTLQGMAFLPNNAALLLSLIPAVTRYTRAERVKKGRSVLSLADAGECLKNRFLGEKYELLCMLSMDEKGKLIAFDTLERGTVDETAFYVRNITETALRRNARYIVLSHNHPHATPSISLPDAASTKGILPVLAPLGILLLDQIVVADGEIVSLRQSGVLPESLFLQQDARDAVLQSWLQQARDL